MGGFGKAVASGLGLRHDWGSQYRAKAFQAEIKWLGIRSTPAYVDEPECNGDALGSGLTGSRHLSASVAVCRGRLFWMRMRRLLGFTSRSAVLLRKLDGLRHPRPAPATPPSARIMVPPAPRPPSLRPDTCPHPLTAGSLPALFAGECVESVDPVALDLAWPIPPWRRPTDLPIFPESVRGTTTAEPVAGTSNGRCFGGANPQ